MAEQVKQAEQKKDTFAMEKRSAVDVVAAKVRQLQQSGQLHLPPNYSADNAMKSAWLVLQSVTDKDGKAALSVCTLDSIANSLLHMVILGLNPDKQQGYFIVRAGRLYFDPSYFGDMHVAKQVEPDIEEIYAEVVYEGDTFEYEIKRGRKTVSKHQQSLTNVDKTKIMAAYCTIIYRDGKEVSAVMTIDEIKQSWKQSPMKPFDEKGGLRTDSTHAKFPAEMAKRTVIRKACKPIIKSSDDSNLLVKQVYEEASEIAAEAAAAEEIAQHANCETIDIDIETGEVLGTTASAGPPAAEKKSTQEGQTEPSAADGQKQGEGLFSAEQQGQQKRRPGWGQGGSR